MKFAPGAPRASYGSVRLKLHKLFAKERAGETLPCIYCGNPHARKCDFIISSYVRNGVRTVHNCNRLMCKGCSTTFHSMDQSGDTIDYCPEHYKVLLENQKK